MKQILCVFIVAFDVYLSLLLQAQNLSYKSLPKNLTVTLNYWQQINDFFTYNEKLPEDCNIKCTINRHVLICPAWVKIIINKKQLLRWQQQQNKNNYINLYLPKIGILHEKAKITKIKKVIQQAPTNKNQQLVTAVYMRYAHVLKYKIKDIDTGKISEITATPEHKFYETTYKKFMAISKLGSANTITNASNHHLKIICTNNRQNNCGTAELNSLQKIYNIEVKKTHNYFAGNMKILVHNGCYDHYYKCKKCDEIHAENYLFFTRCFYTADKKHYLVKIYQCEYCGMSSESSTDVKKHQSIHESNSSSIYACNLCNGKLRHIAGLRRHQAMHEKLKNTIFCGGCDEFISLTKKLNKAHVHNVEEQSKNITEHPLRIKSRSPIKDFLRIIDTVELPDFSNLDLPDLSSYEN